MINNPELLKLAKYKLGVFDSKETISEEVLNKILEITINDRSLSGQIKNIDLAEIRKMPKLKRLTLANFDIQKSQADSISSLQDLETLEIEDCRLDSQISLPSLVSLSVRNSVVGSLENLPVAPNVEFHSIDAIDISQFAKFQDTIKNLSIFGGKIKNAKYLNQFEKLESISIVGSQVDRELIDRLTLLGIEVEYSPTKDIDTMYVK